jgi:ferredoxin
VSGSRGRRGIEAIIGYRPRRGWRYSAGMAFIVTDNCNGCRFTDCVLVCPVDCFYGDGAMLYIHPDECIDCSACLPVCPVQAIYVEADVPPDQQHWIAVNRAKCEAGDLECVSDKAEPLPGAAARKAELGF